MSDWGVVRSDSIVEVHSDVIEAARDESHGGANQAGAPAAPKSPLGVQKAIKGIVSGVWLAV